MDFDDLVNAVVERLDQKGLLSQGGGQGGKGGQDGDWGGMCFMSVDGATDYLKLAHGDGAVCRRVAEYVIDPKNNVFGTANEFFNFVNAYLVACDYYTAHKVAVRALRLYPYDTDLLAVAIEAATGCAAFDVAAAHLAQAERVGRERWNWRLFLFGIEYYQARLLACEPQEAPDVLAAAFELAKSFQKYLPADERGYDKEAELYLFTNDRDSALRVLEHAIFETVEVDGERVSIVAPQCCITMLDDILKASTDYDLAIRVARRGQRNTAQAQPSANTGYFVFREALAQDAIICGAKDMRDGFGNTEKVKDALMTYRCAYDLLADRPAYLGTIRKRYSVLCHKSGIDDLPLVPDSSKGGAEE